MNANGGEMFIYPAFILYHVSHGFAVSATKRSRDKFLLQVSYTLSKVIDDTVDFITDLQPANQLDLRNERSVSSFDQRHRLTISSVLDSVKGIKVAPVFTYSGGHPFNLLLGFDANNDSQANTDRPLFAGRNTGRGPNAISFDLRVAKEFRFRRHSNYRFEGVVEGFNILNRVNFSGINNIVGTAPFTDYRVEGRRHDNDSVITACRFPCYAGARRPDQAQAGVQHFLTGAGRRTRLAGFKRNGSTCSHRAESKGEQLSRRARQTPGDESSGRRSVSISVQSR